MRKYSHNIDLCSFVVKVYMRDSSHESESTGPVSWKSGTNHRGNYI